MSNITLFENDSFGSVRFILENDSFYVVGKDVLRALEYAESSTAAQVFASVPTEWTAIKPIDTRSENGVEQSRDMLCLSEQGLYFFLGRSDKPAALPYQKWIASEVIPSIRKTGSYAVVEKPQAAIPTAYDKFMIMRDVLSLAYEGNQLVLAVDKVCVHITGESALQTAGAQLIAPQQKQLYTPTQIGKNVNPIISAVKVNKILEAIGYQVRVDDTWEKCGVGESYGVYLDTGKAHSDGTPIRQLKWTADIIFAIQDYLNTHSE